MYLEKFMNKYEDWQERLSAAPYYIEIKNDGPYYILKYNMIQSNFSYPEVIEARGSIFTCIHNEWKCVCRSLDKFGNWGESYAVTNKIDWSKPVSVQEKVDGSIMRLWFHKGVWHLSTNGTIDAFKADCSDSTYGDVFKSIVCAHTSWWDFLDSLSYGCCYWFEMVHPQYNPIVVHYNEPAIYFLGWRDINGDMNEIERMPSILLERNKWIKIPHRYTFTNLNDVLEACHNMGENEEGYVICAYNQMENNSFLRIKCKGDEYLKRHKLRGNGPLTTAKIISLWQTNCLDDFLAYFPENATPVDNIIKQLRDLWEKADIAYDVVMGFGKRKDFALRAQSYIKPIQSYLFARLDKKVDCAQTYFKQMKAKNLADLIEVKEIELK